MTKTQRVLEALQNGEQLTAKQIAARFSAGNPREVVRNLRAKGFAIYANQRTKAKVRPRLSIVSALRLVLWLRRHMRQLVLLKEYTGTSVPVSFFRGRL